MRVLLLLSTRPNLCFKKGPDFYALKVFDRQKLKSEIKIIKRMGIICYINLIEFVVNEILILGELNHKNVIKLVEVLDSDSKSKEFIESSPLYLVLEFAEHGESLTWNPNENNYCIKNQFNKRFNEQEINKIMKGAVNGLSYRLIISSFSWSHSPRSKTSEYFDG